VCPVTGQNVMENGMEWRRRDETGQEVGEGVFDWRAKGTRPALQVARQGCAILIRT